MRLTHQLKQWIDLGVHPEVCLVNRYSCGVVGGAMSLWVKLIDCPELGGIITTRQDVHVQSNFDTGFHVGCDIDQPNIRYIYYKYSRFCPHRKRCDFMFIWTFPSKSSVDILYESLLCKDLRRQRINNPCFSEHGWVSCINDERGWLRCLEICMLCCHNFYSRLYTLTQVPQNIQRYMYSWSGHVRLWDYEIMRLLHKGTYYGFWFRR